MVRAVHKLYKLSHNAKISNLPKPYLDYLESVRAPRERVIDEAPQTKFLDYNQDHETGYVYRVPDQPIRVTMPPNSDKALYGGLGVVEGFEKPKRLKPRIPRAWAPDVERHTFYSEILDVHINVEVTDRTLQLIDENRGFDFYILNTRTQDLMSEFGRRLKHKLLVALATSQSDFLKEKYKDFIKPLDEVSWHGLKEHEALTKFKEMRVEETIEPPLRLVYARQLIESMKEARLLEKEDSRAGTNK